MLDRHCETPNFGFTILAPEYNCGLVASTVRSIKSNFRGCDYLCYVGKDAPASEVKEIKKHCPCYKGKDTITSMMNASMKKHKQWNIFVMAGASIKSRIDLKYNGFYEDELDVFFPIFTLRDRDGIPTKIHSTFEESTLNGLCMHSQTFKKVGPFYDCEELNLSRLGWMLEAQQKGIDIKYKAILGPIIL
jgi:hypothetical protein